MVVDFPLFSHYDVQTIVLFVAFYKTALCVRVMVFGYVTFVVLDGSHFLTS